MTLFRSSMQLNIVVKNPFGPNFRSMCPFGFRLVAIQPFKAFSFGQNPINFPIRAWCFMNWIWVLILWLGNSIFGHPMATDLQVVEVTLRISSLPTVFCCLSRGIASISCGSLCMSCLCWSVCVCEVEALSDLFLARNAGFTIGGGPDSSLVKVSIEVVLLVGVCSCQELQGQWFRGTVLRAELRCRVWVNPRSPLCFPWC